MWEATLRQAAGLPQQASLGPQVSDAWLLQALSVSDSLCCTQEPLNFQAPLPDSEVQMLLLWEVH